MFARVWCALTCAVVFVNLLQACQQSLFASEYTYGIASNGTEQMWIDVDGTPYIYYTGPKSRQLIVHLKCNRSATIPVASTIGDTVTSLVYVS